jgi:hypothetical protein
MFSDARRLALRVSKLTYVAACLLMFAAGCGRKDEPAETQESTAKSTPSNLFDQAKGTAVITGRIKFDGPVPPSAQIKMSADPVCISMHKEPVTSEELVVINGNLANVFVYVKEGLEKYSFPVPLEPATLSQEGCRYVPHVGGIMAGQDLRIVNNDPTLHNVHCLAEQNQQFNLGQPIKGAENVRKFAHREVMVKFRCDVHKWMTSYMGVLPHPYYSVSGGDGAFSLKNLPPGEYLIEAWHEKLGTQSQKIVVGDKEIKEITFSFKIS